MLATFVIGLREGIEAALIVGMIATYLVRRGRRDALRQMWLGVGAAVAVSLAVGIGLKLASATLPERGSEIFATVVGIVAVGVVTYMAVWMRQHARHLRGQLEDAAAEALDRGSMFGLVAMAFFAVLREGFETAVFLVAILENSASAALSFTGALIGLAVAVLVGYGLYSGGIRLDVGKFFRATGLVLVLVAAGLVVNSLGSAAEAELLGLGQGRALDLSGLVAPGSAWAALAGGVLGLVPYPTVIQVVGWLAYAVPLLLYVGWPRGRQTAGPRRERLARFALPTAAVLLVPLVVLVGVFVGPGSAPTDDDDAAPVAAAGAAVRRVVVPLTDAGCAPRPATVTAGAVRFVVRNSGSSSVTEAELTSGSRVLGEKENLSPGMSGAFTLRMTAGRYTVSCPGADTETATLVVRPGTGGQDSSSGPLRRATQGYQGYVIAQVGQFVASTERFAAAVKAGDVAQAKQLYAPARVYYERIEPVAESFGALDPAIDARINDVADPARWTGFHPIEQALWIRGTAAGMAPLADRLVADAQRLRALVATTTYQPAELANGSVALLEEVAKNKITGEEDRYSRTDLTNVVANVEGAQRAFELLRATVAARDPQLAATLDARFAATNAALAQYRDPKGYGGYVDYGTVTQPQRRQLATVVDALGEPLSRVAATVV